jgi:hypothetical protein
VIAELYITKKSPDCTLHMRPVARRQPPKCIITGRVEINCRQHSRKQATPNVAFPRTGKSVILISHILYISVYFIYFIYFPRTVYSITVRKVHFFLPLGNSIWIRSKREPFSNVIDSSETSLAQIYLALLCIQCLLPPPSQVTGVARNSEPSIKATLRGIESIRRLVPIEIPWFSIAPGKYLRIVLQVLHFSCSV